MVSPLDKLSNDSKNNLLKLISDIKSGKITTSRMMALRTLIILKNLVTNENWSTAKDILEILRTNGKYVVDCLPKYTSVANIIRHTIKIVREEYMITQYKNKDSQQYSQSLHQILTGENDKATDDYNKILPCLKESIISHISEVETEIETSYDNIINQADEHIHSKEVVLTIGGSTLVEYFLKKASKKVSFQVIIAESAPNYSSKKLAKNLQACNNLQVTLIPDSTIFAITSRVTKVIISTHAVLANGGLRAFCGAHTIGMAAKYYSVPVIVLTPLYKLSSIYLCSYEEDSFNVYTSPEKIMPYATSYSSKVRVYNPLFDYVPPELVTLFITNQGGNAPSYIYRLLSELYHPDDYYEI